MPQRSSGKPSRRRAAASIDAARASAERRARSVSRRSRARCAGRRRVCPGTRASRAVIAGAETPRGNGGGQPSGGPDRPCRASTAPSRTARAMLPEERASARSLDRCRMRNAVRHRSDHCAPPAPRDHGLRQPAHATPPSAIEFRRSRHRRHCAKDILGASRSRRPPADCARSARRPSASWRWMPIVRSPSRRTARRDRPGRGGAVPRRGRRRASGRRPGSRSSALRSGGSLPLPAHFAPGSLAISRSSRGTRTPRGAGAASRGSPRRPTGGLAGTSGSRAASGRPRRARRSARSSRGG